MVDIRIEQDSHMRKQEYGMKCFYCENYRYQWLSRIELDRILLFVVDLTIIVLIEMDDPQSHKLHSFARRNRDVLEMAATAGMSVRQVAQPVTCLMERHVSRHC